MGKCTLIFVVKVGFLFYRMGHCMKIDKIINNNIVSALEPDGKEIIVMGRGIGKRFRRAQLKRYFVWTARTMLTNLKNCW